MNNIKVRDRSSLEILHSVNIRNVQLIPDLASYNLKPQYSQIVENFLIQHGLIHNDFIIIVLRPFRNLDVLSLFANIIRELVKDNRIILVPFSKHPFSHEDNDLNVILQLKELCKDIYLPIFNFDNIHPNEVLYLISRSRLVISSRLHPLIFAKVANVESIALLPSVHTQKVRTFAEEHNIPIVTVDNLNLLLSLVKNMSK